MARSIEPLDLGGHGRERELGRGPQFGIRRDVKLPGQGRPCRGDPLLVVRQLAVELG